MNGGKDATTAAAAAATTEAEGGVRDGGRVHGSVALQDVHGDSEMRVVEDDEAFSEYDSDVEAEERKQGIPWYIVTPENRRAWDILQAIILVYVSIMVPVRVGFGMTVVGVDFVIDMLIDVYFITDIGLSFISAIEDDNNPEVLVTDLKKIMRSYLSSWFIIDILASMPTDLITRIVQNTFVCSLSNTCAYGAVSGSNSAQLFKLFKLLRLIRLIKLVRIVRIGRLVDKYQDQMFLIMPFLSLGKLILGLLFMAHIMGCFFFFFSTSDWRTPEEQAEVSEQELSTWLTKEFGDTAEEEVDLLDKYIASMYWAFTTMTTVGYGDISATTKSERTFAIIGMIVGGFIFSAVIASMSDVYASTNVSGVAQQQRMDQVSCYVREAHLPELLRTRVLSFFRRQHVKGYDENQLLAELPFALRSDVLAHCYSHLISRVGLFEECDNIFITEVCARMRTVKFANGATIFQRGEIGTHVYFLDIGSVNVLDALGHVFIQLQEGAFFGEGAVACGVMKRAFNYRSHGPCELCLVKAELFQPILDAYPEIKARMEEEYENKRRLFHRLEYESLKRNGISENEIQSLMGHRSGSIFISAIALSAQTSTANAGEPSA